MDYGKIAFGFLEICLALLIIFIPFHSKKVINFFKKQSAKKRIIEKGKFDCPHCKSEQNFKRVRIMEKSGGEVERYILCTQCNSRFETSIYSEKAENGRIELAVWGCPKCQNQNPNSTFICTQCNYSLS